ncbi:MAG TPA: DUF2905 domain-containing protein [Bryobacteraceae bacterium]|jgi:hypothetical protein|nr:DUF2905 domain-containing protein [Bryobacteraceae bacterium]
MHIGRVLIVAGLALAALGLLFVLFDKLNIPLGHLPGDIVWRGRNTTFYFPVVTCILLSLLGSFILWLFNRR